mgnify:CR=1 FL=1|jgi:hypothetical protein|tara:strand:- start:8206 stop:9459 length:1254 start_codon:yes stop_codon:yes gene_type:complete
MSQYSEIRVNTITDSTGSVAVDFENGLTIGGKALDDSGGAIQLNKIIDSADAPSDSASYYGLMWYDSANTRLNIYTPIGWRTIRGDQAPSGGGGSSNATHAFALGGTYYNGNYYVTAANHIETLTIATTGNATDFGDITASGSIALGISEIAAGGDHSRIVLGSALVDNGYGNAGDLANGTGIHYITCATPGNTVDFGDLPSDYFNENGGDAGAGYMHFRSNGSGSSTSIVTVTIQTTGNASDLIDLSGAEGYSFGGVSSNDTRALAFGGRYGNAFGVAVDYFTPGNSSVAAADFGDLLLGSNKPAVTNDNVNRTIYHESYNGSGFSWGSLSNTLAYLDTATLGNAVDFGDLSSARQGGGASANNTRALFFGGESNSSSDSYAHNTVDYVTVATPGNATDFGDVSRRRQTCGSEGIG